MIQNFSSHPSLGLSQNQGYEYLSLIYRMKEEHDLLASRGITPYIMPIKVLVVACLAIEEYVNVAGFRIDPDWVEFDHENESIKDSVEKLFNRIGMPINFDTGVWKDVMELFETERRIKMHSRGLIRYHEKKIPDVIIDAASSYPIRLSQAVAENAIQILLTHSSFRIPLEKVLNLV